METWPVTLQDKLNTDSFSISFGDTLVTSGMDVGPDKVRSRYTDGVDEWTSSIYLDYPEYEDLFDFYKTTLNNGAKTFSFTDPMTGLTGEFRFATPPTITPLGGRFFKVSMKWIKMP
jgi:hypothetical protein